MTLLRRLLTLLALTALLPAGVARASATQEGIFQDDDLLVYAPADQVSKTLDQIKALGADRLRVSVFWNVVAPDAMKKTKPSFDATDPAAYPNGAWDRYDTLVRLAQAKGLSVTFNITSPCPLWATGKPQRTELEKNYEPDADEFAKFVQAVGVRYSGLYVPPAAASATPPATTTSESPPLLPPTPLRRAASLRQAPEGALPRVSSWTVWNEPNQPGWLTPQWALDPRDTSHYIEVAPQLYRKLIDAMYGSLVSTGHQADTILIGETAPKGNDEPVKGTERADTRQIKAGLFIRSLFCLDRNLNILQGTSAEVRGCPASGGLESFPAAHPGLFKASGYAHHPYELLTAVTARPTDPDFFTVANTSDLVLMLRRIWSRYRQPIPGGGAEVPLWYTEYGQQTNPPDKTGVSPTQQAKDLDYAEWTTFSASSVQSLTQFLLVDDKPMQGADKDNDEYGGSFQTGLRYLDGSPKPALAAYRLPLYLPSPTLSRAGKLKVFGMARAAPSGTAAKVRIDVRGVGVKAPFKKLKTVTGSSDRGYFVTTIPVKASGAVRLTYAGQQSRVAPFTVKRKKR